MKFFYILANILFAMLFLSFFIGSAITIYGNLRYFEVYKTGKIIEIGYTEGSRSDGLGGTYANTILTDVANDTTGGGTQKMYKVGDRVKLRYRSKMGNVIYEVNGKSIGSKYDVWDWLSPFLLILTGYVLYRMIKNWSKPFRKKHIV